MPRFRRSQRGNRRMNEKRLCVLCGVLVDASADIPLCLLPVCLSACLSVCLPPREGTTSSICPLISTARPPSAFRSLLYCLCHRLLLFLTLALPVTLLSAFISIIFLSCHTHLPPFFPRLHILLFFSSFPGVSVRRCRLCSPHVAHRAPAVRVWAVCFVPTYSRC